MRARPFPRILLTGCVLGSAFSAALPAKPVAPMVAGEIAAATSASVNAGAAAIDEPPGPPLFDTTPTPLPANVPSVGFEATATSELGQLVRLAGSAHFAESITVILSSHAIRSDFPGAGDFGFSHPVTLTLYAVDRRGDVPAPGTVLVSTTQTFLIPWRPEPDAGASSMPLRPWRAADGNAYTGRAFPVTFLLGASALSLPGEVIVAVSFNTEHYGAKPLGVPGPYNFLHVGMAAAAPTTGASPEPGAVYWRTALPANYSDAGAAGVNRLRRDTGWTSYQPALRVNDSPYGMLSAVATTLRNAPSEDVPTVLALVEASDLLASALDRSLWEGNARLRPLWGRLVFDLAAEAADQVARFATPENPMAATAHAALATLLGATQTLAESALGDALLASGDAERILRAQDAFSTAGLPEHGGSYDHTISQLADAWREAELSLR